MSDLAATDDDVVAANQEMDRPHLSKPGEARASLETESSIRRAVDRVMRMLAASGGRRRRDRS